ncbi:MAG: type II toxin-antitoxin system RelE/ParE family toxin [Ginsengibacter sp.]
MEIRYLSSFSKDLKKIKNKEIIAQIEKSINDIKIDKDIRQIKNLKKLKGHNFAYRIRIKDFRIGIFIENNIVEFVRVLPRKDIYESFP